MFDLYHNLFKMLETINHSTKTKINYKPNKDKWTVMISFHLTNNRNIQKVNCVSKYKTTKCDKIKNVIQ